MNLSLSPGSRLLDEGDPGRGVVGASPRGAVEPLRGGGVIHPQHEAGPLGGFQHPVRHGQLRPGLLRPKAEQAERRGGEQRGGQDEQQQAGRRERSPAGRQGSASEPRGRILRSHDAV